MSSPYAQAAQTYWAKGWENPIPVGNRPGEKTPPPGRSRDENGRAIPGTGYTGRDGLKVGHNVLQHWIKTRGDRNIAIRLPRFLIAFDIDGDEGFQALMAVGRDAGEASLPVGPYSTAHGFDAVRRHLFFRVPADLDLSRVEGILRKRYGEKLDLLHHGHRYAIVAPSVHPDGGIYTWFNAVGEPCPVPAAREEIPELPAAWVDFLRALKPPEGAPGAAGDGEEPDDLFTDGPGDHRMTVEQVDAAWGRAIKRFEERFTEGNRNNAIRDFAFEAWHYSSVIDEEAVAEAVARLGKERFGWPELDHEDIGTLTRAWVDACEQKQWVAQIVEKPPAAPGEPAPLEILPPPGQPLAVARELKALLPASDGVPHLAWWQDDFYRWTGAHWEAEPDSKVRRWLYRQTGDAVFLSPAKKEGDDPVRTPWAPTKVKIANVLDALGVAELQHDGEEDRVLAAANGVIERRQMVPHSPRRFNLFSLPFDYDPAARAPAWQAFLDQVLPGDRQSQDFLGEWFGYVLSGRTEQQKMAALIGKKRTGKGTIARVLGALVGKENVSGLNLSTLGGTFGLEPFVGSALAVASDVRWASRSIGDAVQILLEVSGEDHITVNRKNRPAWKGRLGVRFMLMSNDTPTFSDRSGALVDRMLYVVFRQSFFGREDVGLTNKLMTELPGILNWALDGLDRLDARGRFVQPDTGLDEAESTRRLADPVGSFIEDWCLLGEEQTIVLDHLYLKYRNWCEAEGRTKDTTTKEIFSRDLRTKVDNLSSSRKRDENGKFITVLKGIGSTVL